MEHTRIDLADETRRAMISLLNRLLVDLTDLDIQIKLAHWNVRGPHFIAYHELFDRIGDHVGEALDSVAERVATLGGVAGVTVQTVAQETALPPWPMSERHDTAVMAALADRLALVANRIRRAVNEAVDDVGTADLLTEVSRTFDHDLWFLEAHEG
jgi:starvation-inducible DNA-binding protein